MRAGAVRRAFSDFVISGSVLLLLLVTLVLIDPRVREHVASFISNTSPSAAGSQLGDVAYAMIVAARNQSLDHAPLMIFVVVATVLFLAMVRTT
jgi:hypothetical protein